MAYKGKRVAIIGAWVVSLAVANYLGGVVGFEQGFRTHSALFGGDMAATVAALRAIRRPSCDEATRLLETQLDSQIAEHVFVKHAYHSPYNLFQRLVFGERPLKDEAHMSAIVWKYRQQYPPATGDRSVNQKLLEALAGHQNVPSP